MLAHLNHKHQTSNTLDLAHAEAGKLGQKAFVAGGAATADGGKRSRSEKRKEKAAAKAAAAAAANASGKGDNLARRVKATSSKAWWCPRRPLRSLVWSPR